MSNIEQTLSIIKPDAVERNLSDEIKNEFNKKNFKIIKEKKVKLEKSDAEKFYQVHQSKPFYNDLCNCVRPYCCDDSRKRKCCFRKQKTHGCD